MTRATVAPPLAGNALGSTSGDFVIAEWRGPGDPSASDGSLLRRIAIIATTKPGTCWKECCASRGAKRKCKRTRALASLCRGVRCIPMGIQGRAQRPIY